MYVEEAKAQFKKVKEERAKKICKKQWEYEERYPNILALKYAHCRRMSIWKIYKESSNFRGEACLEV